MVTKILIGNILDSKAHVLINTVNCIGIMGKGIALEFKKRFSEMFKDYELKCKKGEVILGRPYIYKELIPPWIINFPTKKHWRSVSKIEDIQNGLQYLVNNYKKWGIQSLAVPPLGCGNGQLEWYEVGPIIYKALNLLDIPIEMYAPFGTHSHMLTKEFLDKSANVNNREKIRSERLLNESWLVLVEILHELEKSPYHTPVGRTIFQKIAYVVTEMNLPTNFKFEEKSFGPFSRDIKKAITILANNGLILEEQQGKMFRLTVGTNYQRVKEKHKDEISKYRKIIDKTADLFARMNTHQAEIATTIFYSTKELKEQSNSSDVSESDVLDYVMEWKKRKRPPYDKKEIASAIRNLAMLKWLDVRFCNSLPVYDEV